MAASPRFPAWRALFVAAALLIMAGGPLHPRGTMEQMLAHPDWVLSHTLLCIGFGAMLAGLILFGRSSDLPVRTQRWVRIAVIGTALQVVETIFHTAAVVDSAHLVAGEPTPVLTIHLVLAVLLYPLFSAAIVGLIVAGVQDRALGSIWIAWLGILGAVAHGLSAPLVVGLGVSGARILFPMLMLLAIWLLLAGVWPRKRAIAESSALRKTEEAHRREPARA